ncbi:unnamed protein product [Cladocopium goreaui]|uniref:Cold-shock domain-containing protein n=1 Tax=Cladocopium goreaui TaxID=2562237 RepID=A0A9P1FF66_9DINO|nr:unnamed protein product [Cladocopium goreaui]
MPDSHGEVRTPEDAALVRVLGNLMSSHPQSREDAGRKDSQSTIDSLEEAVLRDTAHVNGEADNVMLIQRYPALRKKGGHGRPKKSYDGLCPAGPEAPRIVNMALPELTFVRPPFWLLVDAPLPTKALVAKRSLGVIVQVGNDGGMIECPELEAAFGSAVLVGRNQLGPYTVGQEVSFAVTINEDNKPQAFDLQVIPGLGLGTCYGYGEAEKRELVSAAATSLAAGVLPLPLLPLPGLLPGLPGLPGALPGATLPPGLPAGLPATLPGALPGATLPGLPAALSAALPAGLPLPMPGLLPGLAAGTLPPELPPQPAPVVKTPPAPVQTPTQSPNGDQILGTFLGVVRTVDEDKGFGFITSDQLRGQGINEDCYVHKHYLGREFNVGSEVSFTAFLDARNGRPRAKDLKDAKGKVGPQSTMMPPAAPTLPGAGLGLPGLGLPLPGLGAGLTAPAPGMPCAGGEKEDSIGTYKGTVKSGGLRWVFSERP